MDIMDIIKNPIMIGFIAGMLTYMYIKWKNEPNMKNKKNKKKREINLLIPLVVFILFWFISYAYFSSSETVEIKSFKKQAGLNDLDTLNKYKLARDTVDIKIDPLKMSETTDPESFNLATSGVYIPNKLPDIFFDIV
jgi:flagellar basal body-associated protein FliL